MFVAPLVQGACPTGACPQRGAAMIQRVNPSAMLQRHNRVEAPAPRKLAANSLTVAGTLSSADRSALWARTATVHQEATKGSAMLKKTMAELQDPSQSSNELDQLITEFMNSQGSSQDRCPAKLLEAKHQLNQLHKHMYSVAWEINSTQTQLKIVTKEIEKIQLEWEAGSKDCEDGKEECETETSEYKKQWEILIWELIEMKQIANPNVVITASDMSYAAWESAVAHNWTSVTETSSKNFTEWKETTESSGTGIVPDYEGTGDKPPWWPSLIQVPSGSVAASKFGGPSGSSGGATTSQVGGMAALMAGTKDSAREYHACLAKVQSGNNLSNLSRPVLHLGQVRRDPTGGSGSTESESSSSEESSTNEESSSESSESSSFSNISEECKAQLIAFEITYYKAYRQVTRLISEYELLVNSTTCIDEIEEECTDKEGEWTMELEKYRQKLEEYSAKQFHTKGHIEVMSKQEKALTVHIQMLSETCADMDDTISDLDKVRDAIQIFATCAGLGRPQFHIPTYAGETKTVQFDTTKMTDDEIDAKLNEMCASVTVDNMTARAAEIGELMQQALAGMPTHNPSMAPLYGTCPHCRGWMDQSDGQQHVTGYFRNCWPGSALLDGHTMLSDCGADSMKAALCVVDRLSDEAPDVSLTSSSSSAAGPSRT